MKIIARYDFREENPWEPHYAAMPFLQDGAVWFAWGSREIRCLRLDGAECRISERASFPNRHLALPRKWRIVSHEEDLYLSCGNPDPADHVFPDKKVENLFLSLEDGLREVALPPQYACKPTLREEGDVQLGAYTMRWRNSRSYECLASDGKVLWQEKHKGYRYTDFEVRNGCVIFGTAGHGGGLYCYRLLDGTCLCAVDTKGTARYCWQGDLILTRGREGELLWVDPFANRVAACLKLDTKLTDDSGICGDAHHAAVVGFHPKTHRPTLYLIEM